MAHFKLKNLVVHIVLRIHRIVFHAGNFQLFVHKTLTGSDGQQIRTTKLFS